MALPEDLIIDILSRLPVQSLLRFSCVCKPWCFIFGDPKFSRMLVNRSNQNNNLKLIHRGSKPYSVQEQKVEEEEAALDFPFIPPNHMVEMVGSCDGLLCMYCYIEGPEIAYGFFFIWNPCTREFHKVPKTSIDFPETGKVKNTSIFYGFGRDPTTTDDYKIVSIVLFLGDDWSTIHFQVKLYSLRSNSWRSIQVAPFSYFYPFPGVVVNDTLHWISMENTHIVAFDLAEDDFKDLLLPLPFRSTMFLPRLGVLGGFLPRLGVLGGFLAISWLASEIELEVWVMREHGVQVSWTKLFTFADNVVVDNVVIMSMMGSPICFSKSGDVIFDNHYGLLVYHVNDGTFDFLQINGIVEWCGTQTFVATLVPLNSSTYLQPKSLKSKRKRIRMCSGM